MLALVADKIVIMALIDCPRMVTVFLRVEHNHSYDHGESREEAARIEDVSRRAFRWFSLALLTLPHPIGHHNKAPFYRLL